MASDGVKTIGLVLENRARAVHHPPLLDGAMIGLALAIGLASRARAVHHHHLLDGATIGHPQAGTLLPVNLARVAPPPQAAGVTTGGPPAVANRENQNQASLMTFGMVAGDSRDGGDQTPQAGRVESPVVVAAAADGALLENPERVDLVVGTDGEAHLDGAPLENPVRVDLAEVDTDGVVGEDEGKAERVRKVVRDRNRNLPRGDIGFG